MGKADNRRTPKMKRRKAQSKKKERLKRQIAALREARKKKHVSKNN